MTERNRRCGPGRQRGFTLVEISMVLIVIGMIIGAVSIGRDLQRNASYQAIQSVFIQAWVSAYQNYHSQVGVVVGDDAGSPTSQVDGAAAAPGEYCGLDLVRALQRAGVQTPDGRGPDLETRFAYQDANGNPQEVVVCFEHRDWAVPNGSGGYQTRGRNVMVVRGLTPDLARFLDARLDNRVDARFGQFRESNLSGNAAVTATSDWSLNALSVFSGNSEEGQIRTITAHYLMNP